MNIIETIKQPTREEQIMAIEVGKPAHVPYEKANSFRGAISREIKYKYPEAEFETEEVELPVAGGTKRFLEIRRIA